MFILQQLSKEWGGGGGREGRGCSSSFLYSAKYLCMDLYLVYQASFPYVVFLLLNQSLRIKKLNESPSHKTGFLFNYLRRSNILTSEKSLSMEKL